MPICTLTNVFSWITCAEASVPLTEVISVALFFFFFMIFGSKGAPLRESLPPALFLSTLIAASFLGFGAINVYFVIIGIILTALSAVFLYSQNNPV